MSNTSQPVQSTISEQQLDHLVHATLYGLGTVFLIIMIASIAVAAFGARKGAKARSTSWSGRDERRVRRMIDRERSRR